VNAAYDTSLSVMRNYRNLSITQSKRYILTFTPPGNHHRATLGLCRPGVARSVTVATFTLPPISSSRFKPDSPPPLLTASASAALRLLDQGMGLGSLNYIMFMPDGSSQDTLGNYDSGVLYLTRPGDLYSSRAVSVFGTTGRVRGWRFSTKVETVGVPTMTAAQISCIRAARFTLIEP